MKKPRALPAGRHALLVSSLTDIFELVGVSASLVYQGAWRAIHLEGNVLPFELRHGLDSERVTYNQRYLALAEKRRELVVGEFAGLCDFFVPVVAAGEALAFLVTGPVAREQPTSEATIARWRWLSGRQPQAEDPEFAEYLTIALSTLVLEGGRFRAFQTYLRCLARLMAGEGSAEQLFARAEPLRQEIEQARAVERMWETARSMVDPRSERSWPSPQRLEAMQRAGVSRAPDQALVGLLVSARPESDVLDGLLLRRAFQRDCAELCRKAGEVVCGRVGDQGVTFLLAGSAGVERKRRRLLQLGERAASLARKLGFKLHLGLCMPKEDMPLGVAFQAALAAAEGALLRGDRVAHATASDDHGGSALRALRRELGALSEERPQTLPARFDRYLEAVALHYGYRLEAVRAHLEAGFERVAEGVLAPGVLGERSDQDLFEELERTSREARTMQELFAAYRRAVSEISRVAQNPVSARRDRSLQRAMRFIQEHYAQALSLEQVARVAGFAPNYFSQLFKTREHATFEQYLRRLRIERAKHLLASTELGMRRIAALTGFSSPSYFATVFKRTEAVTPLEFRLRNTPQQIAAGKKRRGGGKSLLVHDQDRRRTLPR